MNCWPHSKALARASTEHTPIATPQNCGLYSTGPGQPWRREPSRGWEGDQALGLDACVDANLRRVVDFLMDRRCLIRSYVTHYRMHPEMTSNPTRSSVRRPIRLCRGLAPCVILISTAALIT
jgi:hypothetical protein